jgi:hypothetical protein
VWDWVPGVAAVMVSGLAVVFLTWVIRSHVQDRRRARVLAQLAAQYWRTAKRTSGPASTASESPTEELPGRTTDAETTAPMPTVAGAQPEPGQEQDRQVTVGGLVARIRGEGLPVRLRWEDEDGGGEEPGEDEWPTEVLTRTEK